MGSSPNHSIVFVDAERAKISSASTSTTSEFTTWSEWSGCSTTCSDGTRSRTRTCPGPYECVGVTTESETCSNQATCYSKFHFHSLVKLDFFE